MGQSKYNGTYGENTYQLNGYDVFDDTMKMKSVQIKFRDEFNGSSVSTADWDVLTTNPSLTTVSTSILNISSGTNANDFTTILSKQSFTIPMRLMVGFQIGGTRDANTEIRIGLVSEDGQDVAEWIMDGTVTTTGKYSVMSGGITPQLTTTATILATSTYALKEIELFADECWFHDRAMDSSNGRALSVVRQQQIPHSAKKYKIRVTVRNGATAPATASILQMQFVSMVDFAELTTEITAGRGGVSAGQGLPVTVANQISTVTANLGANALSYLDTTTPLAISGVFTGTSRDNGTTTTANTNFRVVVQHLAGLTHGNLAIEQSTDGTTWRETHRMPIPSDSRFRIFEFPIAMRFVRVIFRNGATAQTGFFLSTNLFKTEYSVLTNSKQIPFTHSTTPLTASTTFTGVTLDIGSNAFHTKHRALVVTDQTGTLQLQQSTDGVTWRTTQTLSVVANTIHTLDDVLFFPYARVVLINGVTAQTNLLLTSTLLP